MGQAGDRRHRPAFEPPPWEREAFERLAREQADKETPRETSRADAGSPLPPPRHESEPLDAPPEGGREHRADPVPTGFESMLEVLRGEEAVSHDLADQVSAWGGLIVGVLGFVMFVWAVVGLLRGGGRLLAFALAIALMCTGALFAAAGAWLTVKSLKRQGVL